MLYFSTINRYIAKDFLKITFNVTLVFFCLGIILNLFEEINFFKEHDIGIVLPLLMSLLKVPHLTYNLFPFIILISSVWLFLKMIRTDEITAIKVSGISNAKIVLTPCYLAFLLGVIFVLGVTPVTSLLAQKYFSIKGSYSQNNDYLAAITVNGIWIKEKNQNKTSFIRANKLKNTTMQEVSIYEFDQNNKPLTRMEAEFANIKNKTWILKNVKIFQEDENIRTENIKELEYSSAYDIKSIEGLYSNIETVSFWNLKKLSGIYANRGYSVKEIESKFHKSIAFPFFLLSMSLLAGVCMLGLKFRGKYIGYIFFSIITCVIIYYFNDFSKALGETDKLPTEVAVWMPILIVFIFSAVGLINVNQK